ncbi:MAG: 6-phosphogluconolactonase [Solirubrobacteraceae bacterium]
MEIRVVEDPAAEVAELFVDVACAGGHVALSGGSTPRRAYELAAEREPDLSAATLWLGDERIVPHDDERSNLRMVRAALTDRLPEERRPRLMAVETALGHDAAAAAYESLLRENIGNHPRLDLALMGLGPDGHTASLFPGKPAVQENHRFAVGVAEAGMEPLLPRMTLTLTLFNTAREVVFLVAGADKATAVRRAFGTPPDETAPAALVRPGAGTLTVVLDAAAAAELASDAASAAMTSAQRSGDEASGRGSREAGSSMRSGGKRSGRGRGEAR